MTYAIYHIPGKKIGVTNNVKYRVEEQQGYNEDEYEILVMSDDIDYVSHKELELQREYGYRVDEKLYKQLKCNQMNINITEQTTTFPCPINKLKGQLMDNLNMKWETDHGDCIVTNESIKWIMKNVVTSKYNEQRCYVYNKAFARWFDNNSPYPRTGGIMSDHRENGINMPKNHFDLIRKWASERDLYKKGDAKTQALKLVEEVGETCKAILKSDQAEIEDGIGDEIKNRKGKMNNGTFKKD